MLHRRTSEKTCHLQEFAQICTFPLKKKLHQDLCSTDPCRRWCSNVLTKTKPHDPSPLQHFFLPQLVCMSKMCVRTEHFGVASVFSRMLLSLVRRDNLDERMKYLKCKIENKEEEPTLRGGALQGMDSLLVLLQCRDQDCRYKMCETIHWGLRCYLSSLCRV